MVGRDDPIEIDLGDQSGIIQLKGVDELVAWADSERDAWIWIDEVSKKDNALFNNIRKLRNTTKQISVMSHGLESVSDSEFGNKLNEVLSQIKSDYATRGSIYSKSPEGQFFLDLAEQDKLRAASALAPAIGASVNLNDKNAFSGAFDYQLFLRGAEPTLSPAKKSFEEKFNEISNTHTDHQRTFDSLAIQFNEQLDSNSRDYSEQKAGFRESLWKIAEKANAVLDDARGKFTQQRAAYREFVKVKESVNYWETKKSDHGSEAQKYRGYLGKFGSAGILVIILFAIFLYEPHRFEFLCFWQDANQNSEQIDMGDMGRANSDAQPAGKPVEGKHTPSELDLVLSQLHLWKLGAVGLLVTLHIWIVRLIVRTMLSHQHLEQDANERITMIMTYLALIQEGRALEETDRQLIMQALFRPSTIGVIKDDAAPLLAIDMLTRTRGSN